MIKLNKTIEPKYFFIGADKTPVIVIDDFVESTEELCRYAQQGDSFTPDGVTGYPGIRLALPKDYVVAALKPLMQGLYKIYQIPPSLTPAPRDNYFSLVTTAESDLMPLQTMPHFDSTEPHLLAVMHYLSDGEHGGTGFFTDKSTGMSYVNKHNKTSFYQCLERYVELDKLKLNVAPKYCDKDNDYFTCYHEISYRPNRLVIFPGKLLHSALVRPTTDISSNPNNGRLTANMFIDFK